MAGRLDGKIALGCGWLRKTSILSGIARRLDAEGAKCTLTYQEDPKGRTERAIAEFVSTLQQPTNTLPMDVLHPKQMDEAFSFIEQKYPGLDILVHSLAYAPGEILNGNLYSADVDQLVMALRISALSLIDLVKRAVPLMEKRGGGTVIAMTYIAGERPLYGYTGMDVAKSLLDAILFKLALELGPKNIRLHLISAGPIPTTAARGIAGFGLLEELASEHSPLRQRITIEDIGGVAAFLCSDDARKMTGQRIYVDSGWHIAGTPLFPAVTALREQAASLQQDITQLKRG